MEGAEVGLVLKEQTGRTLNQLREEARLLSQAPSAQQVSKMVADLRKPTWRNKVTEVWINMMLSGPKTHIANMVGNAAVAVNSILETGGAAAIGGVRRAVLGARAAESVRASEVAARTFGLIKGSQEGVIAAGKALLDENVALQTPHERSKRADQPLPASPTQTHPPAGPLPHRRGTNLFKAIAFRQEINALAARQSLDRRP